MEFTIDQTKHYLYENGFNEEELIWFNNLKSLFPYDTSQPRTDRVKLLPFEERTYWVYDKVLELANTSNQILWQFDIQGSFDSIQYIEQFQNIEYNNWQMDLNNQKKITIIAQLSKPEEYEGGEIQIWSEGEFRTLPKISGSILLFPSYLLYRITPVTRGMRRSFVMWLVGTSFK